MRRHIRLFLPLNAALRRSSASMVRGGLEILSVQRAFILPVVLFVLILLGLLGAVFAFRVHADAASTQVLAERLHSRLAAEAGVEWVKLFLRTARMDRSLWRNNRDAFHRIVVWAQDTDATTAGTNDEFEHDLAYRFSIVADDPTDDETYIRFGLTDEASKLNLNTATDAQLLRLVRTLVADDEEVDAQSIVDAIIDWRDTDANPRGEAADTEGDYYRQLDRPYAVKNGPFDTVEELLLVKGVTPALLYGEDFDRNGLLTDNEDDGDLSFPPDNADSVLQRGLYSYLTVLSYESNVSNDNRPRTNLLGPEAALRAELEQLFPDEPDVVDFVVDAAKSSKNTGKKGSNNAGDPTGALPEFGLPTGAAPATPGAPAPLGRPRRPNAMPPSPGPEKPPGPQKSVQESELVKHLAPDKLAVRAQLQDPGGDSSADTQNQQLEGELENQPLGEESTDQGDEGGQPEGDEVPSEGDENLEGDDGTGDDQQGTSPIRSPADLMLARQIGDELTPSPLEPRHLALLLDRTSVTPPNQKRIEGLININTASRVVLESLEALMPEQIEAILAERDRLDDEMASSPAWLVSEGVVDVETFAEIAPWITARTQQFGIESLGYSDHWGMVTRLQVVVDMVGPIAQTIYYRDTSYLGAAFPIREEDLETQRAR